MKNLIEDSIIEVVDNAPKTPMEAHLRIREAEEGIANGEVILHEDVIEQSYNSKLFT